MQIETLAQFIGTLVATKPAVPLGPLHFRALQHVKSQALNHQAATYQSWAHLSKEAQKDLRWWRTQLPSHHSTSILRSEASIVMESNASNSGWGAACQGIRTGGRWTPSESVYHINYLELKAAFLALQTFMRQKSRVGVLLRMDNRTAIAYVNKMGGPTLSPLCTLALQIWEWCLDRDITLHAEYLPGRDNIEADWESRHQKDSSDWQLLPLVFTTLNNRLGPFTIDLFASRTNAQLELYYSWKPDPAARAVDAFSVAWTGEKPYLFPPFNMIGRALTKIREEVVEFACLIAPAWPAQIWYPQLLKMLVRRPILLPNTTDLLCSPEQCPHSLVIEERMFLAAWPISGRDSQCKVFQTGLPVCSCNPGENTLIRHITQPGRSGVAGVLQSKLIRFQPL